MINKILWLLDAQSGSDLDTFTCTSPTDSVQQADLRQEFDLDTQAECGSFPPKRPALVPNNLGQSVDIAF